MYGGTSQVLYLVAIWRWEFVQGIRRMNIATKIANRKTDSGSMTSYKVELWGMADLLRTETGWCLPVLVLLSQPIEFSYSGAGMARNIGLSRSNQPKEEGKKV